MHARTGGAGLAERRAWCCRAGASWPKVGAACFLPEGRGPESVRTRSGERPTRRPRPTRGPMRSPTWGCA
eukprot:scaffold4196_cov350-Prasinococcus_capsulatus_cf.AAC.6